MSYNDKKLIFITCLFSTISFFLIDFYLPSFPSIRRHFNAIESNTELMVSCYLLGIGSSQLIYGILSDRFGRKNILIIGIFVSLIANFLSVFATSLHQILLLRTITGLGAGACPAIARAILSDKFEGEQLLKSNSYLSMSITMSPAIAPLIGGLIEQAQGWKFSFLFVSGWCVFATGLLIFAFKETLPNQNKTAVNLLIIKKNGATILANNDFLSSALISCFSISASLSYYVVTPFIFQQMLHLTPLFNGSIYIANAIANLLGACYVNRKSKNISPETFLELGIKLATWGSLSMLILSVFCVVNIFTIVFPMLLVNFAFGLIMPSSGTIAIRKFKATGGISAAILGSMRMGGSALILSTVAFFNITTQFALSWVLLILFTLSYMLLRMGKKTSMIQQFFYR